MDKILKMSCYIARCIDDKGKRLHARYDTPFPVLDSLELHISFLTKRGVISCTA